MTDETIIRIKGDPAGGVAAFDKVGSAGERAMDRIQRANDSIRNSAAKLTGVIVGLSATFGATAFMSGVKAQLDMADAMDEAAQKAGVSTKVFSEWAYAGRFASLETESLVKVFAKVNEAVVKAASGDDKMKSLLVDTLQVQVRNASGQLMSADQVLMQIIDRLSGVQDQTLKSSAAVEIFGEKMGPQLLPLINLTKQGITDLTEEANRLGVTISDEAGAAAGDLKDQLDRLKATQEGLYNQIMTQMLPGLNALATSWLENNKNAGVFKGTLKTMASAAGFGPVLGFLGAGNEIENATAELEKAKLAVQSIKQALASSQASYGIGGYLMAGKSAKQLEADLVAAEKKVKSLELSLQGLTSKKDSSKQGGQGSPVEGALAGRISAEADGKDAKSAKDAAAEARRLAAEKTRADNEERKRQKDLYEDRVAQLRLQLAEWRNNTDKQLELANQIADRAKEQFGAESQEYSKAQQEIVRIKQRAADQQRQIEDELRNGREAASLASIAMEQQQADQALALGLMTQRERIALEEAFEDRITDIKRKAMQERLQILQADPDMNPVERERIPQQIEELERQHQQRKGELKGDKKRERQQPAANVINSFEQNLSGQTTQLLMQQQTTMEALRNLWTSTASVFIDEMVSKPLAAWVAGQARMTLASLMGTETRTAAAATGAAAEESITAASVVKMIAMKAWSVAASVYAAIAGIPYIGPFLAPVMAVGALAAVMGFARNVYSAEGGFDIPAGVNPMVQAHQREMILPAKYADVIRGMAGGGGGGAGGGSVNVTVQAIDQKGVEKWLRGGGGAAIAQEMALRQRSRRAGW